MKQDHGTIRMRYPEIPEGPVEEIEIKAPVDFTFVDTSPAGANGRQVGGTHYKLGKHETWDVITAWGLGFLDGNVVKYMSRWRTKGGVQDLLKARHYLDKLIEELTSNGGVK